MTLSDSARKTIIGAAILHAESKETLAFDDFDFDEEDTPPDDKENQNYAKDMKEPEIEKNTSVDVALCSTVLENVDDNSLAARTSSASNAWSLSKSKAVINGRKRFHEWKLRRRGSARGASSPPESSSCDVGISSGRLVLEDEAALASSGADSDVMQQLQARYASMDISTADVSASATEAACLPDQDSEADQASFVFRDISDEDVGQRFKDWSQPVTWRWQLPVWPITVELAVGLKRTINEQTEAPARMSDPEAAEVRTGTFACHCRGDVEAALFALNDTAPPPSQFSLAADAARLSHWKTC